MTFISHLDQGFLIKISRVAAPLVISRPFDHACGRKRFFSPIREVAISVPVHLSSGPIQHQPLTRAGDPGGGRVGVGAAINVILHRLQLTRTPTHKHSRGTRVRRHGTPWIVDASSIVGLKHTSCDREKEFRSPRQSGRRVGSCVPGDKQNNSVSVLSRGTRSRDNARGRTQVKTERDGLLRQ